MKVNAHRCHEVHNWKAFWKQQREVENARSALTPKTCLHPSVVGMILGHAHAPA